MTDRVCPPLSLPRPVATDVIDGEGRRVNWTSHSDWRRAAWWCTTWLKWRHYEWSYVRYFHNADPATKAIFQTTSGWHHTIDHVRSSSFLADILTSWVLIRGAYYTYVYRFLHCDKNLRLGCILYLMAYYIQSFTVLNSRTFQTFPESAEFVPLWHCNID